MFKPLTEKSPLGFFRPQFRPLNVRKSASDWSVVQEAAGTRGDGTGVRHAEDVHRGISRGQEKKNSRILWANSQTTDSMRSSAKTKQLIIIDKLYQCNYIERSAPWASTLDRDSVVMYKCILSLMVFMAIKLTRWILLVVFVPEMQHQNKCVVAKWLWCLFFERIIHL